MKHIVISIFVVLLFIISCDKKEKDNTPPVIELLGNNPQYVNKDSAYVEYGARVTDDVDGDISDRLEIIENVNTQIEGTYYVIYNASDKSGNEAEQKIREVRVLIF